MGPYGNSTPQTAQREVNMKTRKTMLFIAVQRRTVSKHTTKRPHPKQAQINP
jgi:hypothetical protein